MTSGGYDLYVLGYTCATVLYTKIFKGARTLRPRIFTEAVLMQNYVLCSFLTVTRL